MGQRETLKLAAQLDADTWLDVRYEDLVRAPEPTLRRVCEFLDEDYTDQMLRFYESPIARARRPRFSTGRMDASHGKVTTIG